MSLVQRVSGAFWCADGKRWRVSASHVEAIVLEVDGKSAEEEEEEHDEWPLAAGCRQGDVLRQQEGVCSSWVKVRATSERMKVMMKMISLLNHCAHSPSQKTSMPGFTGTVLCEISGVRIFLYWRKIIHYSFRIQSIKQTVMHPHNRNRITATFSPLFCRFTLRVM